MMEENYQKSEYELLREKNIRELEAFMRDEEDSELVEALTIIKEYSQILNKNKIKRERKKPVKGDPSFRFNGILPNQRRRSDRLANMVPQNVNVEKELLDDTKTDDIENVYFKPKAKRFRKQTVVTEYRENQPTAKDFENIVKHVSNKVYNSCGSTCHQCRQKTLDTKSFCHNADCTGVRGQICGPCLTNRYGENVADTLRDPFWICPCCRNECNCSLCRRREGKIPTGILTPTAVGFGYNSVLDYLKSKEGEPQKPNINIGKNCVEDILHKIQDRTFNKYTPLINIETEKGTKLLLAPEIRGVVAEKRLEKSNNTIALSENGTNTLQAQIALTCNDTVTIIGQEGSYINDIVNEESTYELPFVGYFTM